MNRFVKHVACSLAVVALAAGADWRQFRGTDQSGVAENQELPVAWSEDSNVAWKTSIPGRAVSGPIVVDGKVIVTSASGARQDRLHVVALDPATGKEIWHRQFWATGRTLCHPFSSVAANTPASDGKQIYAFFSSNDLICLDLDGNLRWYRGLTHDYPTAANDVGMSASPCIIGDTVVVQVENEVNSFAAGIDAATGAERWKVQRPGKMNWASPAEIPGENAVVLQSPDYVSAHDVRTGRKLWSYDQSLNGITSPLVSGGSFYVATDAGLAAITRKGSSSDVEVRWTQAKLSPNAASPLVHQGKVYVLNRSGVLSCGNLIDGEVLWQLRLKGPYWATPIVAGNYLYAFNSDGLTHVVELGNEGKIAAENQLSEKILGSPAVVDGAIYLRSEQGVYKIAGK